MNLTRARRDVLADRTGGLSVSIPDVMVSIIIRFIVIGGLIGAIGAMLVMAASTTASTKASAAFQASELEFDKAVAVADVVRGSGTDTVALMTTTADDRCKIVTWRNAEIDGLLNLITDTVTTAGECTTSTPIPSADGATRTALVSNVSENVLTYENVGGRAITFNAAGDAAVAAGAVTAKPASLPTQDWEDTRPERVTLHVEVLTDRLTTFAQKADIVGFAPVIAFADAKEGSTYTPSGPPIVAPSALSAVQVTRSPTTGDLYSGTREGARVSFLGGECMDTPSQITITWTPAYPAGQDAISATFTKLADGKRATFDIPNVRNGAEGSVQVAAKCSVTSDPDSASSLYEQTIPATQLAVRNGARAELHDLTWTAVSSLPTTFDVTWAAAPAKPGDKGDAGATTALTKTVTHPAGTTYGFATTYTVTPTVSGVEGDPRSGGITDPWPAAPNATNIRYTANGGSPVTAGVIRWNYATACPAGTVRSTREVTNATYNSTTGVRQPGNYTVGSFADNKNSVAWSPAYALQGHPYEERVETKCYSPVTGSQSAASVAQSAPFITPMASPAKPVYTGYDFQDYVRGDTDGFGTCWNIEPTNCDRTYPKGLASQGGGFYDSYVVDFATSCSTGSNLSNSAFRTRNLTKNPGGAGRIDSFGWVTGWQLADADTVVVYIHENAQYQCKTLWATSPGSSIGDPVYYNVHKRWR